MSQRLKIKKWLEDGKTLTPIDALERFGCFRLAARIDDLRREGLEIETKYQHKDGKRFASYGLARG
tara:strand:+ start:52 stop:249 length:198 start_codon:yes stop_codon:yes gene_type:complete